jgi:hypothetical protein
MALWVVMNQKKKMTSVLTSLAQVHVVQDGTEAAITQVKMTSMVLVLPEVQSVVTGVILVEVSLITLAGPLKTRKRIIVDLIQVTSNTYHKIQLQNYT